MHRAALSDSSADYMKGMRPCGVSCTCALCLPVTCMTDGHLTQAALQEKKVFDSADWQLAKQGKQQTEAAPAGTPLAPRLAPKTSGAPSAYRRASHLGDDE